MYTLVAPASNKLVIAASTFLLGYLRLSGSAFLGESAIFGFPFASGIGAFIGTMIVYAFIQKNLQGGMIKTDLLTAAQVGVLATFVAFVIERVVAPVLFGQGATGNLLMPAATATVVYFMS